MARLNGAKKLVLMSSVDANTRAPRRLVCSRAAPLQSSSEISPPYNATLWNAMKKLVCDESASVVPSALGLKVEASITDGLTTSRLQPATPMAVRQARLAVRAVRSIVVVMSRLLKTGG